MRWIPVPIRSRGGEIAVDLVPDPWEVLERHLERQRTLPPVPEDLAASAACADVFTVSMLSVLRDDFTAWLASRGLMMAPVPDTGALIVVPVYVPELDG